MSGSKIIAAAGGFIALLASAGVSAASGDRCVLGTEYQVTSVDPYKRAVENGGYADNGNLVLLGADIRVAARPGLTREWLERRLQAQAASGECQFGVANASVEVLGGEETLVVRITSAGRDVPGIPRVTIREPGDRHAADILNQARTFEK
jgi:hypothetical protein